MNTVRIKIDERTRNIIIAAAAIPIVLLGLIVVLHTPPRGWANILGAVIPVGSGFVSFVKVCSSTMRRDKFDAKDVTGFVMAAFVMLAAAIGGFAIIFRQFGLVGVSGPTDDPWSCLYFSVITWTTVGYGDFAPSPLSRPFAATEAMIGYIFMALLTAAAVHIVTKFQSSSRTVSGATLFGNTR